MVIDRLVNISFRQDVPISSYKSRKFLLITNKRISLEDKLTILRENFVLFCRFMTDTKNLEKYAGSGFELPYVLSSCFRKRQVGSRPFKARVRGKGGCCIDSLYTVYTLCTTWCVVTIQYLQVLRGKEQGIWVRVVPRCAVLCHCNNILNIYIVKSKSLSMSPLYRIMMTREKDASSSCRERKLPSFKKENEMKSDARKAES